MSQTAPTGASTESIIQYRQMEKLRAYFESAAEDEDLMAQTGHLHWVMAEIIKIWKIRSCGGDPTDCDLYFGSPAVTVTLRQVLALVPEEVQDQLAVEGTGDLGGSWLDENLMNVLVELCVLEPAPGAHFARNLATDCSMSLDALAAVSQGYKSRLAYLKDQQMRNSPDWNVGGLYTVPTDADRIIFLWNYYENHWTVISVEISSEKWTFEMYNSLKCTEEATRHSLSGAGLLLGHLIRAASNMEQPSEPPVIRALDAAQQNNSVDCGVFAVHNIIRLLKKKPVALYIDPFKRRVAFLRQILHALRDGRGVNRNFSKLSPGEQYWWTTLRSVMEEGPFSSPRIVELMDQALNKVIKSDITDGDKLTEKVFTCIETGLAEGSDDDQLMERVRQIDWREHIDYMQSEMMF